MKNLIDNLINTTTSAEIHKHLMSLPNDFYETIKKENLLPEIQENLENTTVDLLSIVCGVPSYSFPTNIIEFADWDIKVVYTISPVIDEWQKVTDSYIEKTIGAE